MCIENDVDAILDYLSSLKITTVGNVYNHYECSNYRDIFEYYDQRADDSEKFEFYELLYKHLNNVLKMQNCDVGDSNKTKVFLSHSHENFEYVFCVAIFLKNKYGVDVYVDSLDSSMPITTNAETAAKLRNKIKGSDRFIFVGTEQSFNSKWCTWELGLADLKSLKGHVAFFIMNDRIEKNGGYDKNEYVGLYPFIWDQKVRRIDDSDDALNVGYYSWDNKTFVPLKDWLVDKEKAFFKYIYRPNTTEINNKKNIAAFYLSKFKRDALHSLGCDTLTNAFSKLSLGLSEKDNGYLLRRYYEFNDYLEKNEKAFNDISVLRRVKYYYNVLNGMSFYVFTKEIKKMIGML